MYTQAKSTLRPPANSRDGRFSAQPHAGAGLLLVTECPHVRARFYSLLKHVWPTCPVALANTFAVVQRVLALRPIDVAIIDMDSSAASGLEVVRKIVHHNPLVVSIAISKDDTHFTQALTTGAFGYLLKDQADEVLLAQLCLTMAGVPPLAPMVTHKLLDQHVEAATAFPGPARGNLMLDETRSRRLSNRERAVLALIAKGMHITEVAEELAISEHTVGGYLKNIYRKRKVTSRAQAALEARKLGLV